MKIIQFCDSFHQKGGVERVVTTLLNDWCARHDVSLLIRQGEVVPVYPLHQNIQRFTFGHSTNTGFVQRLAIYGKDILAIRKHTVVRKADVLIANGPWCGLLAILALKLPGLRRARPKVFICDHNSPPAFGRLTRLACRVFYRYADVIISLTKDQSHYYRSFNKQVHVIPNPVTYPPDSDASSCASANQVLAVGRLTRQKGFDLLLQAWKTVSCKAPQARLEIVGEGPEKKALLQQIQDLGLQDSVDLMPFTDDISRHYRRACVLAISSRHDGLALVLLEALAHGLPIVSFDCDFGPREVIEHGRNGLLCPPESPEALAETILLALENPELRRTLAKGALETGKQFSLAQINQKWEKLFLQQASQSGQ